MDRRFKFWADIMNLAEANHCVSLPEGYDSAAITEDLKKATGEAFLAGDAIWCTDAKDAAFFRLRYWQPDDD